MNPIPLPVQNPNGLHLRYIISGKHNGEPIDPGAEYFVLRLDDGGKDKRHVEACRKAILVYAAEIQTHLPQLAADIRSRYGETVPGWPKVKPAPVNVRNSSGVQIGNDNLQMAARRAGEQRTEIALLKEEAAKWKDAYENLRDFAVSKGLDITASTFPGGFESEAEMHKLTAEVDLSTPEKLRAFQEWKMKDGSKEGLLNLGKAP